MLASDKESVHNNMTVLISYLLIILVLSGLSSANDLKFTEWMTEHQREYTSDTEYLKRLKIFQDNVELVNKHNAGGHSYMLELNQYADMTFEEFGNFYLLSEPQNCSATVAQKNTKLRFRSTKLPDHVDWRTKGVIGAVKNQGNCGSCWTFSTTGVMESHMNIKYGGNFNLSEQQLVDCAQAFNNHGCKGGLPSQALEYLFYNPGLESELSYPYKAKDENCTFVESKAVAFVSKVVNITKQDEDQIKQAVATVGPVSIAYDVSKDFMLYKKGVYHSTQCRKDPMHVNHAVLVVGYGTDDQGMDYWIVKNSWGPKWGLDGYFLIQRGVNMCGLADCASYPIVSNTPRKQDS